MQLADATRDTLSFLRGPEADDGDPPDGPFEPPVRVGSIGAVFDRSLGDQRVEQPAGAAPGRQRAEVEARA